MKNELLGMLYGKALVVQDKLTDIYAALEERRDLMNDALELFDAAQSKLDLATEKLKKLDELMGAEE